MASIHKNRGSRYYQCCFTDSDGKRAFKSTKQTNTTAAWRVAIAYEDAARLASQERLTAAQMRKVISESVSKISGEAPHLHTIADWCRQWAQDKKLSRSAGTARRYGPLIEEFLRHLGPKANRDISHLVVGHIRSFRDKKLESGLSNASVNVAVKVLRSCLKVAVQQELMTSNPADAVELLPKASKSKKAFTREEVGKILASASDAEWKGLIKVGYFVGARLQNCARIRFEEVDFETGVLTYTPIKQRVGKEPKVLTVPLHPELFDYLLARRKPSGFVFPRLAKSRIEGKTGLSLRFRELMNKAGISYSVKYPKGKGGRRVYSLGFHSLRHAFNSDLANSGVSQEIRQRLIGHASEAVNDGYTTLELKTFAEAINKLSRLEPRTESHPSAVARSSSPAPSDSKP